MAKLHIQLKIFLRKMLRVQSAFFNSKIDRLRKELINKQGQVLDVWGNFQLLQIAKHAKTRKHTVEKTYCGKKPKDMAGHPFASAKKIRHMIGDGLDEMILERSVEEPLNLIA